MSAQPQTQRERDRMLKRVREGFQPEEAEGLAILDAVIVRMKGLNSPIGSSEIQPKNRGLLTKLQKVIGDFPGTIASGHTDSGGNVALNMKLSEQRPVAVHQYLTTKWTWRPITFAPLVELCRNRLPRMKLKRAGYRIGGST